MALCCVLEHSETWNENPKRIFKKHHKVEWKYKQSDLMRVYKRGKVCVRKRAIVYRQPSDFDLK